MLSCILVACCLTHRNRMIFSMAKHPHQMERKEIKL
jgi:hypothetical protein